MDNIRVPLSGTGDCRRGVSDFAYRAILYGDFVLFREKFGAAT